MRLMLHIGLGPELWNAWPRAKKNKSTFHWHINFIAQHFGRTFLLPVVALSVTMRAYATGERAGDMSLIRMPLRLNSLSDKRIYVFLSLFPPKFGEKQLVFSRNVFHTLR